MCRFAVDSHNLNDSSALVTGMKNLVYIPTASKEGQEIITISEKKLDKCDKSITLSNVNDILMVANIKQFPMLLKLIKTKHALDESAIIATYIKCMDQTLVEIDYAQRLVSVRFVNYLGA